MANTKRKLRACMLMGNKFRVTVLDQDNNGSTFKSPAELRDWLLKCKSVGNSITFNTGNLSRLIEYCLADIDTLT